MIGKLLKRLDPWITGCLMILSVVSLVSIFSATYTPEQPWSKYVLKQALGIALGWGMYLVSLLPDHRALIRYGFFGYFATLLLLVLTLCMGSIGMGAQRWINLGLFKFQPSELAKLFLPAFFTYYVFIARTRLTRIRHFVPLLGALIVSFVLVRKQPDLATALLISCTGAIMVYAAGIPRWFIGAVVGLAALSGPLIWRSMHRYQQQRIITFLGGGNMHKERYQIEQSYIAIGSGGLTGRGILQGTQNCLRFLPEGKTDFIFAVWAEETGLIGAWLVLLTYALLFMRLLYLVQVVQGFYAQLFVLGLSCNIILGCLINLAMVIGLLPVAGIPLPFMSYGITHIWMEFASIGWISSTAARRKNRESSSPIMPFA